MELKRSVLLPYAAEDMFDLIEQAEHYPKFVPWCNAATIIERSDGWVAARLDFSYLKLRFGFQTRNPKRRPEWLGVRLVEGPFRHFHGDWSLKSIGRSGCKVEFLLSFEVADRIFDRVAGPAVDAVARSMLEAFVRRAEATLPPFAPAQVSAGERSQTVAPDPRPADRDPRDGGLVAQLPPPEASAMNVSDPALMAAMRSSRLAKDLTPEQADVLAGVVHVAAFRESDVLAREGSLDNLLYEVLEGALGVVAHQGTPEETLLTTLNPGDFAHELGFLDGTERFASLVALSDMRVVVLSRERLESLLDSHPRVVYGVMRAIVRVVHGIQSRMSIRAAELTNYIVKQHGRY